jgi:hypothetical protein
MSANAQTRPSPAEESLRNVKARFQIAEDSETVRQSPAARTPIARQLFSKPASVGKENVDSSVHADVFAKRSEQVTTASWSPIRSTQDTVVSSQASDEVFSPPRTQSTQPTQSFRHSIHDEEEDGRGAGDSFVSAKEAFASKNALKDTLRAEDADAMDVDDDEQADQSRSDAQGTMIHHDLESDAGEDEDMQNIPEFPEPPPRVVSEQYSISAETHEAPDAADSRALAPEPKNLCAPEHSTTPAGLPPASPEADAHDGAAVHHDVEDQMDIDDDVRSPSDNSSPVKPLVRKSSLTFASLPAREPLLAKKSMGNRVSRTSHVDASKGRNSQMGRFTGGKSLGGSQIAHPAETHHADEMDVDMERPELQREESETTKIHNKTSTQRLFERINMLKQQNEAPKRTSQNVVSSQASQSQTVSTQPKEEVPQTQASQPAYPSLPAPAAAQEEEDEDDWISPVRNAAPAPKPTRPAFGKNHTAVTHPTPAKHVPAKLVSVSNPDLPDLSAAAESTTPVGSPTQKRYMDAPLSASKSKLYSAFRAAKEKLIGSSAASAQVKLDALKESPARPKLYAQGSSSDDVFSSPKRTDKPASIFSHNRSPSKDSNKSGKSILSSSPLKNDGRRTRSSTEREKQKEKETREKEIREAKQQQRAEDKLKQMREKEQSKAAAQAQKARAMGAKTPTAMSSQGSLRQPTAVAATSKAPVQTAPQQQALSRPGVPRTNTASSREQDGDSADEMPPPPPPKSQLPTTKATKAPLREPRKITKPSSKETLPKAKAPQKIMVNLKSSQYGPAPPPAARPAPASGKPLPTGPQSFSKSTGPVPRQAPAPRPASALSTKSNPTSKTGRPIAKAAVPQAARPQSQIVEKSKAPVPQPRADLGAARPVSRLQTVQDANRINIPPVNPAKPPKRQLEDETLHRPAKRPSQQAKNLNPTTPAHHAQFAKGKIPFAESAHPPQSAVPQIQYPNGDDIKLPEIMTDSEDEDSENEFEQPSWVNTPNLREMLSNQQLMDPEHIFGPIAPLEMEKVFPNKERHKRFRERTSSAYWANDEVTAEEKRKEREARERLVRDGAWTYNPSPRPTQAGSSR